MYLQVIDMKLKEKNISARKMLLDLHLSNNLLTKWRNGNIPSLDKITAIAEYLDVPFFISWAKYRHLKHLLMMGRLF